MNFEYRLDFHLLNDSFCEEKTEEKKQEREDERFLFVRLGEEEDDVERRMEEQGSHSTSSKLTRWNLWHRLITISRHAEQCEAEEEAKKNRIFIRMTSSTFFFFFRSIHS